MTRYLLLLLLCSRLISCHNNPLFLPDDHYDIINNASKCWGYEKNCDFKASFSGQYTHCPRQEDLEKYFVEADFGYVAKRLDTLHEYCHPARQEESDYGSLQCSEQLHYCHAKNLWIDFRDLKDRKDELLRYNTDVLRPGQIGAKCQDFDSIKLKKEMLHMGPLQSWSAELQNFKAFSLNETIPCDVRISKPTFIMKIDATVNMYHHLCDFFNLYASFHINNNRFSRDNHILIWENLFYKSSLEDIFKAFTNNHKAIWNLNTFSGKRVCFSEAIFPLLPRMLFGLFYNTPLTPNDCSGSGLFKSFSDFVPHRLGIPRATQTNSKKIKVTILSRQTRHRRILNLDELDDILVKHGGFEVTIAAFTHHYPLVDQLKVIRNTDILVGIHGAGLAHMLFLPEWAAVFELYHCDDPSCYQDLAKLRGLKHVGWTNPRKVYPEVKALTETENPGVSAKFTNYAFDPDEFLKKVLEAAKHVQSHSSFLKVDVHLQESTNHHDEL